MTALPPSAARDLAVRLLCGHGFVMRAGNERGDTLYLARAGEAWLVRVSNHARTALQRARRRDILTSLVIREPRTPAQVETLVAAAMRDFDAERRRRADQPSAEPSRK
ncbi:hypothetical protein J2X36_001979 [Methylobacterium sp. BE186]|uniref:hypothetical protein n=1 Tax=Methylobacterium sp. BE186 TaxID=2817715 RepID=UPI002861F3FF|nr:hypothetical protein [Methylobacterium sp. BE186]MDR7037232.1 hypothetical protein [Methylobacterium sp. BE186]